MLRSQCSECPWKVKSQHNENFKGYAEKMTEVGQIKESKHACHMITSDVWGYKNEINESNVCIGSLNINK